MSKMGEMMFYDIQELYIEGMSAKEISEELFLPLDLVKEQLAEMNVADVPQDEVYSPYNGA